MDLRALQTSNDDGGCDSHSPITHNTQHTRLTPTLAWVNVTLRVVSGWIQYTLYIPVKKMWMVVFSSLYMWTMGGEMCVKVYLNEAFHFARCLCCGSNQPKRNKSSFLGIQLPVCCCWRFR